MKAEKNYLIKKLKEAGIKTHIYDTMKSLETAGEPHLGAVLINGETFTRSSSKKTYTDQQGQKQRRLKLFDRKTSFRVIIAHTDAEKVEIILYHFLSILDTGITVSGNWEGITIGEADWVSREDSILRAKVAVQMDVEFAAGIYKDRKLKTMRLGNIVVK